MKAEDYPHDRPGVAHAAAASQDDDRRAPDPAALTHEIERLQRELAAARAEMQRRERERRRLHDRAAYRFAEALVAAKHDRRSAWRIPAAAVALVTPAPVRARAAELRAAWRERVDGARRAAQGSALARSTRDAFDAALRQLATGEDDDRSAVRLLARAIDASVAAGDLWDLGSRVPLARPWPSDRPLVSVVIPCFNYGRYVREAVDSVLHQTLRDAEVIVVEGGSTDGVTPAIVRGLRDPRVQILEQPRPTRVGENRVAGLAAARGKYAVFLDADDLLRPTYLEKAAMVLELTGADLAYPSIEEFDRSSGVWETGEEFTLESMAVCNVVPTVAMFRTDTWRSLEIGYGSHLDVEDYDFWLRFAERGARGVKIREPLMRYRVHGSSLTDAIRERQEEATRAILAEHAPMLDPARVARISAKQRAPLRRAPAPDLARCGCASDAPLRMALAVPWMVVGGADHLLQQVFADHRSRATSLLVYATQEPHPQMGDSTRAFEQLTPDVFRLPRELPAWAHRDAILHLLESRRSNLLLLVGSPQTYELLPAIKARLPALRVVDHLFNPVGHLERNREYAHLVDFHIVANDEVRGALLDRGERPDRIEVVHHGIDTSRYDPAALPRRDDLPGLRLAPRDRLVLFAGRLSEEKGPLRFLEIARRLASVPHLVFAMLGDGPLAGEVDARAEELGVAGRVHRLGFVADTLPYLRRADVVVIPSDVDGLPLVCLEALAMGVPVVASSVGALPHAIGEGPNGATVAPADVAGFADAISRVLAADAGDEAFRARRADVVARFDIGAVRDHYWRVFRRVAGVDPSAAERGSA